VAKLEAVLREDAIIASNTSSLSITAIAVGAKRPGRIAGYHIDDDACAVTKCRIAFRIKMPAYKVPGGGSSETEQNEFAVTP
jgi:hypothetical protein